MKNEQQEERGVTPPRDKENDNMYVAEMEATSTTGMVQKEKGQIQQPHRPMSNATRNESITVRLLNADVPPLS